MHIPLLSRLLRRSKGSAPFEIRLITAGAQPDASSADSRTPLVPLQGPSEWARFEVPPSAFCYVSGRLAGRKLADARSTVLRVRFLDAQQLPVSLTESDELSYNTKHGLHFYPAAGSEKLPHGFGRGFHAPASAHFVEIRLQWSQIRGGSVLVSEKVDLRVVPPTAIGTRVTPPMHDADRGKIRQDLNAQALGMVPVPITRRSNWASLPVTPKQQYALSLLLAEYQDCIPDSIVARFAFFDQDGELLTGRRPGFSYSERAGLYRYLNKDRIVDGLVNELFAAPADAARLDVAIQIWRHDAALPVMLPLILLTPVQAWLAAKAAAAPRMALGRTEPAKTASSPEPVRTAHSPAPAKPAEPRPAPAPPKKPLAPPVAQTTTPSPPTPKPDTPAAAPVKAQPAPHTADAAEQAAHSLLQHYHQGGVKAAMEQLAQSGLNESDRAIALTRAAKQLLQKAPPDALAFAKASHAIYPTPTRQKWLAFLLYDQNDIDAAYALIKTVPAKLFVKTSERTKAKRIAMAAGKAKTPTMAAVPKPVDSAGFSALPAPAVADAGPIFQGCPVAEVRVQPDLARDARVVLNDSGTPLALVAGAATSYNLSGDLHVAQPDAKAPALLRFELDSPLDTEALKAASGLSHSPTIGFYLYLRPARGETRFSALFKIPRQSSLKSVHIRRWNKSTSVEVANTLSLYTLGQDCLLDDAGMAGVALAFENGGTDAAKKHIEAQFRTAQEKADAYEHLAPLSLTESYLGAQAIVRLAQASDANHARIKRLAAFAAEHGMTNLTADLADSLAQRNCLSPQEEVWHRRAMSQQSLTNTLSSLICEKAPRTHRVHDDKSLYVAYFSLPHHSNGYATRTHGLLSALRGSNRKYVVISRPGYPFDARSKQASLSYDEVDDVVYRRLPGPDIVRQGVEDYLQSSANAIEAVARSHGVSIIHCASNWRIGLPSLIAARRLGVPFIYEVRGLWELTKASKTTRYSWKETDQYRLDSEAERLLFQHADHVVPITRRLGQEVINSGASAERITVCPNSIDVSLFTDRPADAALRAQLNLKYPITIGFVGSFAYYEGLDDLAHACRHLILQGYRFNVLLVGDGDMSGPIKNMVTVHGLEEYFYLTGRVPFEDVPAYYSLIDICPFPRKSLEVCEIVSPLKPFEAMAMKKSVVASNVAALTEIVQHGQTGLLFEKGNYLDLAAKLKDLIENETLRKQLGEQARAWVTAERTWLKAADILNQIHWDVVGRNSRAA